MESNIYVSPNTRFYFLFYFGNRYNIVNKTGSFEKVPPTPKQTPTLRMSRDFENVVFEQWSSAERKVASNILKVMKEAGVALA